MFNWKASVLSLVIGAVFAFSSHPLEAVDQAPFGPVIGRAYAVIVETTTPHIGPATTQTYIVQRVSVQGLTQDIQILCPSSLAPYYCTPSTFLGTCTKQTRYYTDTVRGEANMEITVDGVITMCNPTNTGNCTSTTGNIDTNNYSTSDLVLMSKSSGGGCQW